jgi:hypothetical protein
MALTREGRVDVGGAEVPFKFWRRDRSASAAITVTVEGDVPVGEAINAVFIKNIAELDLHASQVFVKRGGEMFLAHLQPRRPEQHAGMYVLDVDHIDLEPFE